MPLALVTGSAIRVGAAISRALADAGYDLILHANQSFAALEPLADEIRQKGRQVYIYKSDLSDAVSVDRLVEQIRQEHAVLDVLVNNAAIFEHVPFAEITREQYQKMQAINADAPFFLTQGLLPLLEKSTDPLVVLIGDIAGARPMKGYAHYSTSKAAVLMLMRALAVELSPHIRVNAVSPGTVLFPPDFDDEAKRKILQRIPLQREGTPEDIARSVVFLAKDAPYITGLDLAVDGGRHTVF